MAFNGQLTGNLGRDPELKYLQTGSVVANFTIAVRQGKKDAPPRWVKVAVWGKAAEYVGNYVKKGDSVLLLGRVEAPEIFTRRDGSTGIAEVFTAENIEKFGERQQQPANWDGSAGQQAPAVASAPAAPAPVQMQQSAPAVVVQQVPPDHDGIPF
jgi:single-strand DNA-binding protein